MMNLKKIIILSVIIFVMICHHQTIYAESISVDTELIPEDNISQFILNIKLEPITSFNTSENILCYDVNENGDIALGMVDNEIYIMDSNLKFLYGYEISVDGTYHLEMQNNSVYLILSRSGVSLRLNSDEVVESFLIIDNYKSNRYFKSLDNLKKTQEEVKYLLENSNILESIFSVGYSRLISIDSNGEKRIIYDVSNTNTIKSIVVGIAVIILIAIVVTMIGRQIYKARNLK